MEGCDDPWEVEYQAAPLYMPNVAQVCENQNEGDACAIKICTAESEFMQQLLTWKMMGGFDGLGGFNPSFKHDNTSGFVIERDCPIEPGFGVSEKECCGDYPGRFPFKTYGGDRKCCGGSVFENSLFDCCSGDLISLSC